MMIRLVDRNELREAIDSSKSLLAKQDALLAKVIKRATRSHYYAIEADIQRYQRDLVAFFNHRLNAIDNAKDDTGHLALVITSLASEFEKIGAKYLRDAADRGFQRLIDDLVLRKMLRQVSGTVRAPESIVQSIIAANSKYIRESLSPALHEKIHQSADGVLSAQTFNERIKLYGHYLWTAAEQAYSLGLDMYSAKMEHSKTLREGGTGSGNHGHAGVPGKVGGSAPGLDDFVRAAVDEMIAQATKQGYPVSPGGRPMLTKIVKDSLKEDKSLSSLQFSQKSGMMNTIAMHAAYGTQATKDLIAANNLTARLPGAPNYHVPPAGAKEEVQPVFEHQGVDVVLHGLDDVVKQPKVIAAFDSGMKNMIPFDIDQTMYHDMEDQQHAEQVLDGGKFYTSDHGYYGPGLYFATTKEAAREYGSNQFEAHIKAHIASLSNDEYQKIDNTLRKVVDNQYATRTQDIIAKIFQDRGFDGFRINDPYGQPTDHAYFMDLKADKTMTNVVGKLGESDRAAGAIVVLFSKKSIMREGSSASGNWDHAGRPGQRGGSASISATIKAMRTIAAIHDASEHHPDEPATKAAYAAFIDQTNQQYRDLLAKGYKFQFGKDDPYRTSQEMTKSVLSTKTLKTYNVVDLPAGHPLSQISPFDGQTENTIFRAVHDMNGHYFPENTFGQRGELKAYQAHARMYDEKALPAMAAETLAQGAWVNYANGNDSRGVQDRPFAPQRAYAFPLDVARAVRDSSFPSIHLKESDSIALDLNELDGTDYRRDRSKVRLTEGGAGSGNYGHAGVPGHVGGSAPHDVAMKDALVQYVLPGANHDEVTKQVIALANNKSYRDELNAKFDAANPDGLKTYRGLSGSAAASLCLIKKGSDLPTNGLISTSRHENIAQYYAYNPLKAADSKDKTVVVFEGVRGQHVIASEENLPNVFGKDISRTGEVILDPKTRWVVSDRYKSFIMDERPDTYGKTYTTTYVHVRPAIEKIREGGAGSGNYGHAGRIGERGGSAKGDPAYVPVALRALARTGGFTVSINGKVPKTGYMIAGEIAEETHPLGEEKDALQKEIVAFATNHPGLLQKSERYIGGWAEKDAVYLDVSQRFKVDRSEALRLARDKDQIAVYHLDKGKTIYTMSDQLRPSESKGTILESDRGPSDAISFIIAPGENIEQAAKKIGDLWAKKFGKK